MLTETITESEPDDIPLLAIQSPGNKTDSRIKVQLEIQGVKMTMELDTGASVSIISRRVYKENFSEISLQKTDTTLKTYTGETIKVLGMFNAEVKCEEQWYSLPLFVVDDDGPSFPVKPRLVRIKYTNLASIFLARLARSCTKSCKYLASLALTMKLFWQDIKYLARILQEKIVR